MNNTSIVKSIASAALVLFCLSACSPQVGSEQWCTDLKEKSKGDWTATESKDFAKNCIF